jgi:hypothetical protein
MDPGSEMKKSAPGINVQNPHTGKNVKEKRRKE